MTIRHIENFVSLFQAFGTEQQPMTLTALSEELGQPKSSMHKMIETLLELGLIYEVKPRRGYYPTRKLHSITKMALIGDPIVELMQKHLDSLAKETGETALLSIRDGSQVMYLGVAESPNPIRYFAAVGDRRPVYATSGGKAIFSSYSDTELRSQAEELKFEVYSDATLSSAKEFVDAVVEGRERGWHVNLSEYTPEVSGVGVPISVDGRRMALSIAGPNYRMNDRIPELAKLIHRQSNSISLSKP